ncbi:MAG: ABC transporter permease [Nocardioides sp.]|uniref:ABC transporter permease n=1 Tax=Nocardioides sp. TaxID=35761 RepID=UPI0039E55A4A
MGARTLRLVQIVAVPIAVFAIVWIATANSRSVYFPPLSTVLQALLDGVRDGDLLGDLGYTLRNLAFGFLIAVGAGATLGLLIGVHTHARDVLMPTLTFFRSMPQVAFIPAIILTLGIGAMPKVLLIAFATFWPILLNTINGVRSINPAILEVSACYRIRWTLRLRKVMLPGALPQFLAGLRVAVAVGLVMVVISEIYGSAQGIGYFILKSSQNFAVADTWAGTILIGIVGYLISLGLLGLEYLLLGWYEQRPPREARRTHGANGAVRYQPEGGNAR